MKYEILRDTAATPTFLGRTTGHGAQYFPGHQPHPLVHSTRRADYELLVSDFDILRRRTPLKLGDRYAIEWRAKTFVDLTLPDVGRGRGYKVSTIAQTGYGILTVSVVGICTRLAAVICIPPPRFYAAFGRPTPSSRPEKHAGEYVRNCWRIRRSMAPSSRGTVSGLPS
jgi:hypothetical protein